MVTTFLKKNQFDIDCIVKALIWKFLNEKLLFLVQDCKVNFYVIFRLVRHTNGKRINVFNCPKLQRAIVCVDMFIRATLYVSAPH